MPATAAELVPTLSTKMVAGEPLVAGETARLSESSAAVLNKYRKLYLADEAFSEAAREDARRSFVAAFALITARSTGGFEHRADAARKAVLGDGAPPPSTPGRAGAFLLFVCGLVGGLLNSWMAVGPDVRAPASLAQKPCAARGSESSLRLGLGLFLTRPGVWLVGRSYRF